jgi:hypothetical protein
MGKSLNPKGFSGQEEVIHKFASLHCDEEPPGIYLYACS